MGDEEEDIEEEIEIFGYDKDGFGPHRIKVIFYKDGAVAFSEAENYDSGFIFLYPKQVSEVRKLLQRKRARAPSDPLREAKARIKAFRKYRREPAVRVRTHVRGAR